MDDRNNLNIIIPLYNPHEGWENNFIESVTAVREQLNGTKLSVVLVNDGSTIKISGIEEITNRFDFLKYCSYPVNQGKGYAIRYGLNVSDADYYIYTDIDFPFGHHVISETYQLLKSDNTNIVLGTRDLSYFSKLPVKRRIYSLLLKELNYFVTGFKIKDTQAGLKGLDNKAKKILAATKTNTFLFELEFLKMSIRRGLNYRFIHVSCRPGIRFTDFRFRVLYNETICLLKLFFR